MLCVGCGQVIPPPPLPPPAPPAPTIILVENLPVRDEAVAPDPDPDTKGEAPPEEATPAPAVPVEEPSAPAPRKDPFNSTTVDDNREGKHIIERALTLPATDAPILD